MEWEWFFKGNISQMHLKDLARLVCICVFTESWGIYTHALWQGMQYGELQYSGVISFPYVLNVPKYIYICIYTHTSTLLCVADTANINIQIKSCLRSYFFSKLKSSFKCLWKLIWTYLSLQRLQTVVWGLEAHFLLAIPSLCKNKLVNPSGWKVYL